MIVGVIFKATEGAFAAFYLLGIKGAKTSDANGLAFFQLFSDHIQLC